MIVSFENPKKLNKSDFLDMFHLGKKLKHELLNSDSFIETEEGYNLVCSKSDLIPYKGKITIVYEDEHVIIVDKPSKMLIHSDGVETTNTLLNRVVYYYHGEVDVKVIHRIDYDTSGLVVFSKNPISHGFLNYQMENGLIEKEYLCVTHGKFKLQEGVIDAPIGSNRHKNNEYLVTKNGKKAVTDYKVLESKKDMNLVRAKLRTGRTHQIRVHMKYLNCPIYSDKIYYKDEGIDLKLKSFKVSFISPRGFNVITVEAKEGLELW